ncbi:unnamed protein product, partial [Allacma fusca]
MLEASIHLMRLIGALVGIWWMFLIAVVQPELYVEILNQLFYDNEVTAINKFKLICNNRNDPASFRLHLLRRVSVYAQQLKGAVRFVRDAFQTKYSVQERLIMMFPIFQLNIAIILVLLVVIRPRDKYHLYSLLSPSFQTYPMQLIICLIEATIGFTFMASISTEFVQLTFFEHVFAVLDREMAILQDDKVTPQTLKNSARACRQLQVFSSLINKVFAFANFSLKISGICTGVIGVSFGLKLLNSHPTLAMFLFNIAVIAFGGFIVGYDQAFGIPSKMAEMKTLMWIQSSHLTSYKDRKIC